MPIHIRVGPRPTSDFPNQPIYNTVQDKMISEEHDPNCSSEMEESAIFDPPIEPISQASKFN